MAEEGVEEIETPLDRDFLRLQVKGQKLWFEGQALLEYISEGRQTLHQQVLEKADTQLRLQL